MGISCISSNSTDFPLEPFVTVSDLYMGFIGAHLNTSRVYRFSQYNVVSLVHKSGPFCELRLLRSKATENERFRSDRTKRSSF